MKNAFLDFVLDQLSSLKGIRARRMFGGYGLYAGDRFFGILYKDRLYFKTNEKTVQDYVSRGMTYFRPNPKQRLKNYYEVPAEILEDGEELCEWARKSCT